MVATPVSQMVQRVYYIIFDAIDQGSNLPFQISNHIKTFLIKMNEIIKNE